MTRSRAVLLVVLLALGGGIVWLVANTRIVPESIDLGPGVNALANDYLAAEQFLERIGVSAEYRVQRSIDIDLPAHDHALLLIDSELGLTPAAAASVVAWVQAGGHLLVDVGRVGSRHPDDFWLFDLGFDLTWVDADADWEPDPDIGNDTDTEEAPAGAETPVDDQSAEGAGAASGDGSVATERGTDASKDAEGMARADGGVEGDNADAADSGIGPADGEVEEDGDSVLPARLRGPGSIRQTCGTETVGVWWATGASASSVSDAWSAVRNAAAYPDARTSPNAVAPDGTSADWTSADRTSPYATTTASEPALADAAALAGGAASTADGPELARVDVDQGTRIMDWPGEELTLAGDEDGAWLVRVAYGSGTITAVTSTRQFTNFDVACHDHAYLLARLLDDLAGLWIVRHVAVSHWLDVLWQHGLALVKTLAIALLLLLWRGARLFGPQLPDPESARRSVAEHLHATGEWLWRRRDSASLLADLRATVRRRAERRFPAQDPARWAQHVGLTASDVAAALNDVPRRNSELVIIVRNLKAMERML